MNERELVQILDDFVEYLDEQIVRPAVHEVASAMVRFDPHEPKNTSEMIGEYLREAAVLILIFVPIDILIPRYSNLQKPISLTWLIATLVLSLAVLSAGMWRERRK